MTTFAPVFEAPTASQVIADAWEAGFDGSSLPGLDGSGSDSSESDGSASGSGLDGSGFDGAGLDGSAFDGSGLDGATFDSAEFDGAEFDGSAFDSAEFERPAARLPELVSDQSSVLSLILASAADAERMRHVDDDALAELAGIYAAQERQIRSQIALVAGEVARRSSPELGLRGFAQSKGHRTPAEFVRVTTGTSLRDATRAVAIGTMLVEAAEAERAPEPVVDADTGEVLDLVPVEASEPTAPWMGGVARGVNAGTVSVEKADAIRRGLGDPDKLTGDAELDAGRIDVVTLTRAADQLATEAIALDVDRLLARARQLRDEIDVAGVARRERRLYEARSFRIFKRSNGGRRAIWDMDSETGAIVEEIRDRVTSPKLGGPRFVDEEAAARAERIENDPRTAEQLASDAFLELLRAGSAAEPDLLLGEGAPAVRVLVTLADLKAGVGAAHIEGQDAPVSLATAERHICEEGFQQLLFDAERRPLDLGRAKRLFSKKQRLALYARDGGCMFPGCCRPAGWCEGHHIRHFVRDHGETNIDDGILLCRHHHRLVHDQGWEFRRRVVDRVMRFEIIPPAAVDSQQTPQLLPTKSPAYRRLPATTR
jgi:hypothetical protein